MLWEVIKLKILTLSLAVANLILSNEIYMLFCATEKKFKYIYQMLTDGTLQDVKALASGRDNQ